MNKLWTSIFFFVIWVGLLIENIHTFATTKISSVFAIEFGLIVLCFYQLIKFGTLIYMEIRKNE